MAANPYSVYFRVVIFFPWIFGDIQIFTKRQITYHAEEILGNLAKKKRGAVIAITVALAFGLLILVFCGYCIWRKRNRNAEAIIKDGKMKRNFTKDLNLIVLSRTLSVKWTGNLLFGKYFGGTVNHLYYLEKHSGACKFCLILAPLHLHQVQGFKAATTVLLMKATIFPCLTCLR